ncbi:MAG: hypothetical protein ACOC4L_01575 [Halanaerobium sp.]
MKEKYIALKNRCGLKKGKIYQVTTLHPDCKEDPDCQERGCTLQCKGRTSSNGLPWEMCIKNLCDDGFLKRVPRTNVYK